MASMVPYHGGAHYKPIIGGGGNHDVSGEARDNNGMWTSGSASSMIDGSENPDRVKELKIPPAWTQVKVSNDKTSPLQATGVDSKGRRQYIYSDDETMKNEAIKFARGKDLIDKQSYIVKQNQDNILSKDPSISEPATVMSLIHSTGIRPGSENETGGKVKAYGATTLEGRHVIDNGNEVRLQFIGKKGVSIDVPVTDADVSKMLIERKMKAGDNGKLFSTSDNKLRVYTKKLNGGGFKPKDFRTLKGTSTAMDAVNGMARFTNMTEYKKAVMGVAKKVSKVLGNTPSIALKSYINPFVFAGIKPL